MSNLWYILNKEQQQHQLQEQLQQQLRQQLELPPSMSDRFSYTPTPAVMNQASAIRAPRDIVPYPPMHPQYPHPEVPYDPNAAVMAPAEPHNNIEWKYHTHRPEADGDSLGRKAGKRKLLIPRELLKMKQMNAALKIGIPPSTFSKRWRESLQDRTWPFRNHRRIEKNIKMLKAMQQKGHDVTEELNKMQQQQEENLSPAVIDVYEDVNEEYLMKVDDKNWTGRQLPPHQAPLQMPQQHIIPPQVPLQIQGAPLQIAGPQLKPVAAQPIPTTTAPTQAPPAPSPVQAPSQSTPPTSSPAPVSPVVPQAAPAAAPIPTPAASTSSPTPSEIPTATTTPSAAPPASSTTESSPAPPVKEAETLPAPTPASTTPAESQASSSSSLSSPDPQLAQQRPPLQPQTPPSAAPSDPSPAQPPVPSQPTEQPL